MTSQGAFKVQEMPYAQVVSSSSLEDGGGAMRLAGR